MERKKFKKKRKDEDKKSFEESEDFSSYHKSRMRVRRGAIQIKGYGEDYTVKGGEWKLWVDTLNDEEMAHLKVVFSNFDKDGSGRISASDLGLCLKYMGENPTEMEIQEMHMRLKKNNTGTIEFPHFATEMARRRKDSAEMIKMAFAEFDESGDGLISLEEIRTFVQSCASPDGYISAELFDDLMKDFDVNGDGYLDYREFMELAKISK